MMTPDALGVDPTEGNPPLLKTNNSFKGNIVKNSRCTKLDERGLISGFKDDGRGRAPAAEEAAAAQAAEEAAKPTAEESTEKPKESEAEATTTAEEKVEEVTAE